jgi:hypothetical protein
VFRFKIIIANVMLDYLAGIPVRVFFVLVLKVIFINGKN